MRDFLAFRKMITPLIIQAIFWIGVLLCVIAGLIYIVVGASAYYGGGGMVLAGVLLIILGPLGVRIYCELLIVMFKILDELVHIRKELGRPGS
ncbi:MAG TPA: DUF4282 domain-containing protein [Candidatus Acetothermia bacterium]|nr:DUF4282 domain-containing protein [Candidatus Acetothermia bacterium]